jgi:predicted AAA+ superfamily ATPase
MILRQAEARVRALLSDYPAVALVGPRQSGKTTLAKNLGGAYFDLELPDQRLRLDLLWSETAASRSLVVLDEAQTHPEVFPRLRAAIDADRRRCGRFLLLGSVSPTLMHQVSESLAGRMALCELAPFSLAEVGKDRFDALWLRGGYPDGGILTPRKFPLWQQNYLALLARRDLPNWGLPSRASLTERLFKMLAISHGQILNASQLGQSLGVSYHTIQSYLEYLEQAFLIRRLRPFHANLKKRLVKSPRIYWRDTGLLHALMEVRDLDTLWSQPWVGHSWEGYVIEQILNALETGGTPHEATFFRTSDGHEADLLLRLGQRLLAIEVKLTTEPDPRDLERLEKVGAMVHASGCCLISRTRTPVGSGGRISTHLRGFLDHLASLL